MMRTFILACFFLNFSALSAQEPSRSKSITPPKDFFGFNIGDDYQLANYKQLVGYWQKLEKESDRFKLVKIGDTEEGRPQYMAVVTSPANHAKLDHYREISKKLALAEGVEKPEAEKLALEGKAVVWIDGGLHASESLCAQALIETAYQLVNGNDAETRRFLDDVIILLVHANPDGQDLVADWYMREKEPTKRSLAGLPRLYQKYIGHDDNRDFYANTQAETKNVNRVLYREWFPQLMYNHHQAGPPGTVMFIPPFRDPANYNMDPMVLSGIDAVGAAMMNRFLAEGKAGVTVRSGAPYSTWFNGGLRTTTGFHNMIGLLSETIGSPTPMRIPYRPEKQLPKADYLSPIPPGAWHFRQSIDYSVTANRAVFDYASREREHLLFNIWLMGKRAVDRGNRDSWTTTPKVVEAAVANRGGGTKDFEKFFRDPAKRDARGYILTAGQPDFPTATKFANALIAAGVKVHRATADFAVAGKKYPSGSLIVKSSQAFRAHVLDMFEPQDHPNDIPYTGAAPTRPYDAAGYTLAYQMGIQFDRILDGFDGPFEEVAGTLAPPHGKVRDTGGAVGYFLDNRANDAFTAVNRLLKAGEEVKRLKEAVTLDGIVHPAGLFYIGRKPETPARLETIAAELGVSFTGTKIAPGAEAVALKPVRVGLWDRYGGSMPSGWTRWILERFDFPFQVVYSPELDKGSLNDKFDVLIFVDGAISTRNAPVAKGAGFDEKADELPSAKDKIPEEYRGRQGSITPLKTFPELKKFLEAGGTILTIGSSTALAKDLGLPIGNHLVETDKNGAEKPLPAEKFYVPTSILRAKVDTANPLAWGLPEDLDITFGSSPTFRLPPDADKRGIRAVAKFDSAKPLRSGWSWGQQYLKDGTAVVDVPVGKGRLVLFGPQILFRAQPHGTFKFLFNGIVQAGMK